MASRLIKSNSTDRTKRQRTAHDANINTRMPKPKDNTAVVKKAKDALKDAMKKLSKPATGVTQPSPTRKAATGVTQPSPKRTSEMAPPAAKKEVKKAVKKTAAAAKKTVKKAVSAVKKATKKTAKAGGGRAAEAGRKAWYT